MPYECIREPCQAFPPLLEKAGIGGYWVAID
jgi:hypothetical protein